MAKTIDENFRDWHDNVFGYGYGTGEQYTLPALKTFFATVGRDPEYPRGYDYRHLEEALTPTVAWLLINTLCNHRVDVIEYGVSPRHGWLTPEGEALKAYIDGKTLDELRALSKADPEGCVPDVCNCGPNGYEKGRICPNPFWRGHH